jgi:hypothetical protein
VSPGVDPAPPAAPAPASAPRRDDPPPFLGTWPRVYAAVLGWLALLVLLMRAFTQFYR